MTLKRKIQEMLSLTDEQLEQVTPDMKVQQIRKLRKPKEVPYFPIKGQLELSVDFPEIMPDPEPVLPSEPKVFTMDIADMIAGESKEVVGDPMILEPAAKDLMAFEMFILALLTFISNDRK